MWKTIYSIDLNLLIGIIGGIISGIFVSYVFLIEAEYRNQFNHVKEMFTCIYGIGDTFPFHMFVSFLLSIHLFKIFYHLHSRQLRF